MNDGMKQAIKRIKASNETAKKRKASALARLEEWRKSRVGDPMVPYVRDGNVDSRPVVNKASPVRRAYLHTYGYTRAERRAGMSVLNNAKRNEQRRKNKYLFRLIWESERQHNAAA